MKLIETTGLMDGYIVNKGPSKRAKTPKFFTNRQHGRREHSQSFISLDRNLSAVKLDLTCTLTCESLGI